MGLLFSLSHKAILKDLASCVTPGGSLKSSPPGFPHLLNKSKKIASIGLFWQFTGVIDRSKYLKMLIIR